MKGNKKPIRFQWMDEVINSNLSSSTKLVLYVLSTYMKNDGNNCWPSISTIAKKSSLSRDTVIRHIKSSEEQGWLEKKDRYRESGDRTSNQYFPKIPKGSISIQPASKTAIPQETIWRAKGVLESYTNNSINNPINKIKLDENLSTEEHRKKMRQLVGSK